MVQPQGYRSFVSTAHSPHHHPRCATTEDPEIVAPLAFSYYWWVWLLLTMAYSSWHDPHPVPLVVLLFRAKDHLSRYRIPFGFQRHSSFFLLLTQHSQSPFTLCQQYTVSITTREPSGRQIAMVQKFGDFLIVTCLRWD